jgi:hypothetical protein
MDNPSAERHLESRRVIDCRPVLPRQFDTQSLAGLLPVQAFAGSDELDPRDLFRLR